MKRALMLLLALAAAVPSRTAAPYSVDVHEWMTERALPDSAWLRQGGPNDLTLQDLDAFRQWLWGRASTLTDVAVRTRFLARFPTVERFTARAFRELLAFNGNSGTASRVEGIDALPAGAPRTPRDLLRVGSSAPDRDGRNRNRFAVDAASGQPQKDTEGRFVPADPATLNLGKPEGLSSQAHAHYGLLEEGLSDDVDVLKSNPERFAIRAGFADGPVLSLAADMMELHSSLALLSLLGGGHGARALAVSFVGQGFHYLQDVGNQIHTVQVGLYEFFRDAKLQYWWRALITAGGYLAPLQSFSSVGVDILSNHHLLIEQLGRARLKEAQAGGAKSAAFQAAVDALGSDDAAFASRLDQALQAPRARGEVGRPITRALIAASAPEGPELYRAMRDLGCGRLRLYGFKLPEAENELKDPDALVCGAADADGARRLEELYALEGRGFARVATAMRRTDRELAAVAADPDREALTNDLLTRFVRERLDLLDAGEARRAAYLAALPPASFGPTRDVAWLIGELVVLLALAVFVWRRSQGGSSKLQPSPSSCGDQRSDT